MFSPRTLAFEAFIFERSGIYIFFNLLKSDSFPIEEGQMRMLRMTIASATAFLNTRLLIILKFLIVFEIFHLNNEHSFIERARRAARAPKISSAFLNFSARSARVFETHAR